MEKLNTVQPEWALLWFWKKEIKSISYDMLPAWAETRFEWYSKRFTPHREYISQNFSWLYVVEYTSDEKVYIATQKKVFKKETGDEIHDNIYLYEEKNDRYLWHAEIFLIDGESFAQVWFTETKKELQGSWYWLRRILILNALTQFFYKKPLVSSTLFCEMFVEGEKGVFPAKKIWEKLAQKGIAQMKKRNKHDSYAMLTTRKTREAVNSLLWEKI